MKSNLGRLRLLMFLLILGVVVSACAASSSTVSPSPTGSPRGEPTPVQSEPLPVSSQDPPAPGPGKASISGVLYTFTGKGPIPGTAFYLIPAGDGDQSEPPPAMMGIREENKDVSGQSDNQGRIVLNNIPPGRYYLAVWAPYNWIVAVESDVNPTPRLIVLEPDQRLNLGVIYLSWP